VIGNIMENPRRRRATETGTCPTVVPGSLSATMTHNDVVRRANELYCDRGCEDGHDMDQWLEAEREVHGTVNVARA
jgi:hypothetical protein